MSGFQRITNSWSTRRIAATALALAGLAGLTVMAAMGWRAAGEAASADAARSLIGHFAAGAVSYLAVMVVIGMFLDRALNARNFHHRHLPARPEFYDYSVPELPLHIEELEGRPLQSLTYTVFDTETTGLRPSQGDEIISIAGVRIRDGRVARDAVFDALVNPGFPVPKPSIRFHGITDDMLKDAPPIGRVLPDFRAFVGDTILVAHNAAFDMRFLQLKEDSTGISFHQVVLDTLLFSVFLDRDAESHTLEAIAERAGVVIEGRHTAIGDAMATAEILLWMLDRLADRGVTSLEAAIGISNEMTAVRKLQSRF
ncbi:MAG TPA: exonuclease domain-containing protein [Alphaproteobacteria bacterium]|nr:exonuclease domain-containing protein [Alphaproteobacteria bacterium]